MKVNAGITDRVLRVLIGSGLIVLAFVGPKTFWGLTGLIPLTTGLVGFCPLYAILGFSTCGISRRLN